MKLVDWQTMQRTHALDELRRLALSPDDMRPTPSSRPLLGPVITFLRESLWRLLGMRQALQRNDARLGAMLADIEKSRPLMRYQMPESAFSFRPDTDDWSIFTAAFLDNEYHLPDTLGPDDIVIDIGAHIGSFSYLALVRGAGRLFAVEPERANFELATRNLRVFGERARVQHKVVWRSDRKNDVMYIHERRGPETGGSCLLWMDSGEKMDVIALDDLLDEATEGGRKRVRILKVDCEGSEYPILLTARKLHLVDHICGEYHEYDPESLRRGTFNLEKDIIPRRTFPERARVEGVECFDRHALVAGLERAGFRVTLEPDPVYHQLGFFFAWHG